MYLNLFLFERNHTASLSQLTLPVFYRVFILIIEFLKSPYFYKIILFSNIRHKESLNFLQ